MRRRVRDVPQCVGAVVVHLQRGVLTPRGGFRVPAVTRQFGQQSLARLVYEQAASGEQARHAADAVGDFVRGAGGAGVSVLPQLR